MPSSAAPSRRVVLSGLAGLTTLLLGAGGCVAPEEPEPASTATTPPPWPAPRDAISNIKAAGLPELPLTDTADPHIVEFTVTVDGAAVTLPPHIGVDRVRAVQAPVHTHDETGQVWLEGRGNREVTLGQFFQLWGVRFEAGCLGSACGGLKVAADGQPVDEPLGFVLRGADRIEVRATS